MAKRGSNIYKRKDGTALKAGYLLDIKKTERRNTATFTVTALPRSRRKWHRSIRERIHRNSLKIK